MPTVAKFLHVRTCCILLYVALLLELKSSVAIRHSDLDPDLPEAGNDCSMTCTSPMGRSGTYELRGEAARTVNSEEQYFISGSCSAPGTTASIVPWMDAQDPLNGIFAAVFADPVLINKLRAATSDPLKLCAARNAQCICKLSGEKPLGVLGRMAARLPHSSKARALQLAMGRCPEGVPDILVGTLMVSCVLVVGVMVWMLWLAWARQLEPLKPEPDVRVLAEVKTPLGNFVSGFSWAAGFIFSLTAMQTGALAVVRKSCDQEAVVWFVAAFPTALALAATLHLMHLFAMKQLAHVSLSLGVILTDLPEGHGVDACLVCAIFVYFLYILYLVSTDFPSLLVALAAMGGSAWTVLKAVSAAHDIKKGLDTVEVTSMNFAQIPEKPTPVKLPWGTLLASKAEDLPKLLRSSSTSAWRRTRLGLVQHGPMIRVLSGSYSGFLVLPALVTLVAASWCISAIHMANYACSAGELTELTLPSSNSLTFAPWQTHYEVITDISYQRLAMVAWVRPSTTRLLFFTPPHPVHQTSFSSAHSEPKQQCLLVEENHSTAVEEVNLAGSQVPRVAIVSVQGLRPSLPPTNYTVRFTPATTLPAVLWLSTEGFQRTIAWSTLHGSVFSVPEGVQNLTVEVGVADFVLGLPQSEHKLFGCSPETAKFWTSFHWLANATEDLCAHDCALNLECFQSYAGASGCFRIVGERDCWEASDIGEFNTTQGPSLGTVLLARHDRRLQGWLDGCVLDEENKSAMCSHAVDMERSRLSFGMVRPDWSADTATLRFSLHLQIGEEHFEAQITPITLHRGPPLPTEFLTMLVGEMAGRGSRTVILNSQNSVDTEGKLSVVISEYDPVDFKKLRLLVMPVLPDPAFRANWSDWRSPSIDDMKLLQQHHRCRESSFLRSRYEICGALGGVTHGKPLRDKPLVIGIDPLRGRPEVSPTFTVVLRKGHAGQSGWSGYVVTREHGVALAFEGVDSPVAWAARRHGCSLLDPSIGTEGAILASADATCELLPGCADHLCEKVRKESLGGGKTYDRLTNQKKNPPALVSPEKTVTLLTCLSIYAPSCSQSIREHQWYCTQQAVHLEDFGMRIPFASLLEAAEFGEHGQGLMQAIRQNLTVEDGWIFDRGAAKELWQLPEVSSDLLATVAALSKDLPKFLARALMQSPSAKMPPVTPKIQAAFANLQSLELQLEDAAQLRRISALASLAPQLKSLEIACDLCPSMGKVPSLEDLRGLSQLSELREFALHYFQVPTLPPHLFQDLGKLVALHLASNQLQSLPPEVFRGLGKLKWLDLRSNQLQSLASEVFQGLGELVRLELNSNQLQSLPSEVFHGLGELMKLDLSSNQLQSLAPEVFHGLGKLQELSLSSNQLPRQPTELCSRIRCA
ncbi:unnamed protein product [Symbiodinium sp. CCMP2592]|nr:unnamed protein product [Symbiodinium sp. CCMP2592]